MFTEAQRKRFELLWCKGDQHLAESTLVWFRNGDEYHMHSITDAWLWFQQGLAENVNNDYTGYEI